MRTIGAMKTTGGRARWAPLVLAVVVFCGVALAARPAVAQTQTSGLQLAVHKTFGFNNGSQIQGAFRLEATGPNNLVSVTFALDGETLVEQTDPPFSFDINTDQFAPGWHTVGATGRTADGQALTAADRRFEFVSAAQAQTSVMNLIVPVFVVVGLLMVVGLGSQLFFALRGGKSRSALPLGAQRNYGLSGGAICPKCQRPFARHWWGLNALPGLKFDRCDHCGKWSLVGRASPQQLAAAETAELKYAQPTAPLRDLTPEEKLKRDLDASRFEEH
jgi:hypothetical protein